VSQRLVSLNPDLSQLRADGYDVAVRLPAHLLVRDVPYVTPDKKVKRGVLVSELGNVSGETVAAPATHVVFFVGECPSDVNGAPLLGVTPLNPANAALGDDLTLRFQISRKPTTKPYPDFHAKMTTLINIVSGPAMELEPGITARTYPVVVPGEDESVFNYLDTAATKAGILTANKKLEGGKVGIVGVGGTGAYVLDMIAKTPVSEIHILDHDTFYNHNAFRCPGAPSLADLKSKPKKVAYLAGLYANMRKGVIAHDCFVDETNIGILRDLDFVFICIDKGKGKRVIVEKLEEWGKSFIDVGMGVQLADGGLLGTVTATTSVPQKRDHFRERVAFTNGEAENEYSRNTQIPDLNALNAALAVIKWKKLRGYYRDFSNEHFCSYVIEGDRLVNEDKAA
jgi:hypothetical protein